MGLTSGLFATLMFAAAGLGLVAVVVCWPLARRQTVGHIAARVGMILVSQVLVIAAFLVYLNSYFGFYGSWSELFGSGNTQIVGVAKASNPNAPLLTITGAAPAPAPGAPVRSVKSRPPVATGGRPKGVLGTLDDADLAETGELLSVSTRASLSRTTSSTCRRSTSSPPTPMPGSPSSWP